ncbi:hypothetical protein MNAN1_000432 [Malassezia nana]|uniref:Uncharacterized protein n=1 Tax=Malassezia nana TaxID=180528 RepID=A0AAF0ENU5_9BASI|nr:hypothetical protein MNAN1_000432 [Malassezia nana]
MSPPVTPDEGASTPKGPGDLSETTTVKSRRGLTTPTLELLSLWSRSSPEISPSMKSPLKANICEAETSLEEAPISYFSSSVPRSLSSSFEDVSVSPPGVMTPHSILFRRSSETAGCEAPTETATPGSSWSSTSKHSDSVESPQSSVTSLDDLSPEYKPDSASESTVVAASSPLPSSISVDGAGPSRPPMAPRQRSRSDVGMRSDSWCMFRGMEFDESPSCSPSPTAVPETPSGSMSPIESPPCPPNLMPELQPVKPSDFSAYVSGIGEPIDPDLESTTVEQLKVFRQHARSRSVGPRDDRSRSQSYNRDATVEDSRIENTLGLSPRRWRMSSPRPPLALMRDTSQIPALKGLGTALCNPGYILRTKQAAVHTPAATGLDEPPRSPRLVSTSTTVDDLPSLDDMDDIPALVSSTSTAPVDEEGFQQVRSRRQRQRDRHAPGYVPRPAAEDPVPPSLDLFEEAKPEPCADEDRRGRSRSRTQRATVQTSQSLGSSLPKSNSVLGVSHRRGSQRRRQDVTYAAIASCAKESQSESRCRGRNRGRREGIKKLVSSQEIAELPTASRETIPSPNEATCADESVDVPRVRLLSNSAHLLMLSLELAMIKNHKIYTPLKPRWGKHRDDDFRPLPTIEQRLKKFYGTKHQNLPTGIHSGSMYQYVDDNGSRLKYSLNPP